MARINTELVTELLNNLFVKLSKAQAEDVSGGVVTYTLGGHLIEHPVHVKIMFDGQPYFISFASDSPISIEKRLFHVDPKLSTERTRINLIAQIDEIVRWQKARRAEGIVLEFSYPRLGTKPRKVAPAVPKVLERPELKRPTRPVPNKVSLALQRHSKKVS